MAAYRDRLQDEAQALTRMARRVWLDCPRGRRARCLIDLAHTAWEATALGESRQALNMLRWLVRNKADVLLHDDVLELVEWALQVQPLGSHGDEAGRLMADLLLSRAADAIKHADDDELLTLEDCHSSLPAEDRDSALGRLVEAALRGTLGPRVRVLEQATRTPPSPLPDTVPALALRLSGLQENAGLRDPAG